MGNFLLSVVIPTKNRQKYAAEAIEQILGINDGRIQLVVQDNSSTDELSRIILKYGDDKRLKYHHQSGEVSFVDNFSLSVGLADGEYVCMIGDDDGILPQIADVAEWAEKNGIEAVKPKINAVYYWPGSGAARNGADGGLLCVSRCSGTIGFYSPDEALAKLLRSGCRNYLSLNMAKLYHGIVKKECLERIKQKTGSYFGGLSPDIYIAAALSLTVGKVAVIDFPVTISGICGASGSFASATGRHTGRLEDAPHLKGHEGYRWSELVPKFYSVETIWADSAHAAICDMGRADMLGEMNIPALAAVCMQKYPQFRKMIKAHCRSHGISTFMLPAAFIRYQTADFIKRAVKRIRRGAGGLITIKGIKNIVEAERALQELLKETDARIEFDSVIRP